MIDRYTKAVLTVIAASLVVIVIQNTVHGAFAASGQPMKVQICDSLNCADIEPIVSFLDGKAVMNGGLSVVPASK